MIHKELITEIVLKIKDNPTATLTQFNNFVNQKTWWEQAVIRFFIYKLAMGLAQHYEVALTDYTENTIYKKVRDWIVATNYRKLNKVIFG